jgi:hypothetical protein
VEKSGKREVFSELDGKRAAVSPCRLLEAETMDIRTAEIPAITLREAEIVRRVEREAEAEEFGYKDNPSGKKPKHHSGSKGQANDDEVDVSAEYLASVHEDVLETDIQQDRGKALDVSSSRLDIEA